MKPDWLSEKIREQLKLESTSEIIATEDLCGIIQELGAKKFLAHTRFILNQLKSYHSKELSNNADVEHELNMMSQEEC